MSALKDVAWTASGQAMAAIGLLMGQRWLTGMVSPEVYGGFVLMIGITGLGVNVLCTPLVQAAIHAFPSCATEGDIVRLKRTLSIEGLRVMRWVAVVALTAAGIGCALGSTSVPLALLILAMLFADSWRTAALAMVNARRGHREYACWTAADMWLRALLAVVAVMLLDGSVAAIMTGWICAAALLLPLAWRELPLRGDAVQTDAALKRQLWSYALPLLPLGVIGWVTGLADRYVIGGTLSLADAGIYAAAAGLASRPMLMLGTAIELVMRPRYQGAVSGHDPERSNQVLLVWLATVFVSGLMLVALFARFHVDVARLLLGPEFRSGSSLMIWIVVGYWALIMSYVFERVCYAFGRTRRVLAIQASTAVAALVCLYVGAQWHGLKGAAMSVPVYYGVQLLISMMQARGTYRERSLALRRVHA